jgi:hypothetical protein
MLKSFKRGCGIFIACLLLGLASGCGGGGGGGSASSPVSGTVTGVATPSSISVVTANNAD